MADHERSLKYTKMQSYGIRCVFELPTESINTKKFLYEERVTVWRATDIDEAIDMAAEEACAYCSDKKGSRFTGFSQAFWMFDPINLNGVEVFSLLRESDLEQEDYLDHFFSTGDERQQTNSEQGGGANPPRG